MERKKLIVLIGIGFVALILISLLIIGIVDGIWPWNGFAAYGKIFQAEETPATTQPAPETEPSVPVDISGEDDPVVNQEGDSTQPTGKNPVLDGEPVTGGNDVKEEVETDTGNNGNTGNGGNTGNSGEGDSTGETTGNQDPNADANLAGSKVPGWGN